MWRAPFFCPCLGLFAPYFVFDYLKIPLYRLYNASISLRFEHWTLKFMIWFTTFEPFKQKVIIMIKLQSSNFKAQTSKLKLQRLKSIALHYIYSKLLFLGFTRCLLNSHNLQMHKQLQKVFCIVFFIKSLLWVEG